MSEYFIFESINSTIHDNQYDFLNISASINITETPAPPGSGCHLDGHGNKYTPMHDPFSPKARIGVPLK